MRASADDADVTRRLQLLLQQLFAAQASLHKSQCAHLALRRDPAGSPQKPSSLCHLKNACINALRAF
jgi:hypothetical protein